MKFRKTVAGFSLIELMIALAVISILASIAYPNYMEYLQRARRAECASVLLGQANAMERRFSTTNSYVGALPGPVQCPADGGPSSYVLGFAEGEPTALTFVIQAVPAGAQTGDRCGTLSIDNTGLKEASGMTTRQCW
jgi:type IV pilus assembly protein PilE